MCIACVGEGMIEVACDLSVQHGGAIIQELVSDKAITTG